MAAVSASPCSGRTRANRAGRTGWMTGMFSRPRLSAQIVPALRGSKSAEANIWISFQFSVLCDRSYRFLCLLGQLGDGVGQVLVTDGVVAGFDTDAVGGGEDVGDGAA